MDIIVVCFIIVFVVFCIGIWEEGYIGVILIIKVFEKVFG